MTRMTRVTRALEEREKPLRADQEHFRSRQEQTLGTLDIRIDAMMERHNQAKLDRLDCLLGNRRKSRNRNAHSREASKEGRVNFKEHQWNGVKKDESRTMLATHYTPLSTNTPSPEELRMKSKQYLLLNPPTRSGYFKIITAILTKDLQTKVITGLGPGMTWTRVTLVQTEVPQTIMY